MQNRSCLNLAGAVQIDMGDQPDRRGPFRPGGIDLHQIGVAVCRIAAHPPDARTGQHRCIQHLGVIRAKGDAIVRHMAAQPLEIGRTAVCGIAGHITMPIRVPRRIAILGQTAARYIIGAGKARHRDLGETLHDIVRLFRRAACPNGDMGLSVR